MTNKPVTLLVLDGWGHASPSPHNAISTAHTPHYDQAFAQGHCLLSASGLDVGVPKGQMGNSEVGHMSIGAGRVLYQSLERINRAIEDGSFHENPTLLEGLAVAKKNQSRCHLIGLLSEGGVHSHHEHFLQVLKVAHRMGLDDVVVHAFLDGRDTPPQCAQSTLEQFEDFHQQHGLGQIKSICGRYYAMDRDKKYDRTQQAYRMLTQGISPFQASNSIEALRMAYERDEGDEFVQATIVGEPCCIEDGDVVLFMNFRADRARQLSKALTEPSFEGFTRETTPALGAFLTLTEYHKDLGAQVMFRPEKIEHTLGEVVSSHGMNQLRIAETEKYAHVTFFFNGGVEPPFEKEDRTLIPSPQVATYDLAPKMSVEALSESLVEAIQSKHYECIIANIANPDMVGHTGNLAATIEAIEAVDVALGAIIQATHRVGGHLLITADHGNAEMMIDVKSNQPHTAHTTQQVPFIHVGPRVHYTHPTGTLTDIAPTMLSLLNLEIPSVMTGKVLVTCEK